MTLYTLKPRFQDVLRPLAAWLHEHNITANHVTLAAAVLSMLVGGVLALWGPGIPRLYFLLPVWFFLRMALNAIDGMLAREFGDKSRLGAYLNELCDQVSDAALILPFALLSPALPVLVVCFVLLAALSEYAGVLGLMVGASRRYDGPMGKSDRALVFGALGTWLAIFGTLPGREEYIFLPLIFLACLTVINRVRRGLMETRHQTGNKAHD